MPTGRETRTVPGYERRADGVITRRYAGVQARLKPGDDAQAKDSTWFILASTIGGKAPRAGDVCWGTDGVERTVKTVGTLTGGEWEVVLERE